MRGLQESPSSTGDPGVPSITNRSRFRVSIRNRDDLTKHFPYDKKKAVTAHMEKLRAQQLKPRVEQLDEAWLVRITQKGFKDINETFTSRKEAEGFILRTTEERSRGLFIDYTKSRKVTMAELMTRYLKEEATKLKSQQNLGYAIKGWLVDSGPAGVALLDKYHEELRSQGKPVPRPKSKMRQSSDELDWIHKPLTDITTVDVESYVNDRLDVVSPATVDREIDRFKAIVKVATSVWDYSLAKNPMNAVRRPKYFNERDRRISDDEETGLLEALAQLDFEEAVEVRLKGLAQAELADMKFTSHSARKKVQAETRARLHATAEETADVIPYLQVFYLFQVMTGARRGETLSLPWTHIDFADKTAFLPETKNGRARKLALRVDIIEHLRKFPQDTDRVFNVGLGYLVNGWTKACQMAGIKDLHIHDARHEAISRLAESGKFTLPELQAFSGHLDLRMLMRYAHLSASGLAQKLDACFADAIKVRVHRGRKYLNKNAELPLSKVTKGHKVQQTLESDSSSSESSTVNSSDGPSTQAFGEAQAQLTSTATHQEPHPQTGNIVSFPVSRIVRVLTANTTAIATNSPKDGAA